MGVLWENFLVVECMKKIVYVWFYGCVYFWCIYIGVEFDYVEEWNGCLYGYEFKWKFKKWCLFKVWLEIYF